MSLNKAQIQQIQNWLDWDYKEQRCPFYSFPDTGKVCEKLFPKILNEDEPTLVNRMCGIKSCCPCAVYGVPYVIRKARRIINDAT